MVHWTFVENEKDQDAAMARLQGAIGQCVPNLARGAALIGCAAAWFIQAAGRHRPVREPVHDLDASRCHQLGFPPVRHA